MRIIAAINGGRKRRVHQDDAWLAGIEQQVINMLAVMNARRQIKDCFQQCCPKWIYLVEQNVRSVTDGHGRQTTCAS